MFGPLLDDGDGFRVSIANHNVNDDGNLEAGYGLENDGDITETTSSGGTSDIGDWITPKAVASAGIFSVRATLNSGALASGTVDSWLALSTSRSWIVGAGGAANLTIEISVNGGTTVLASATITLSA